MRARGRRRLRVLLMLLTVISLVTGGYFLSKSSLFDVDEVTVNGALGAMEEEVLNAANIAKGKPLLEVNTSVSTKRVEQIPWVKEARISRSLGGTVTISISTRDAVAAFKHERAWVIVDIDGRVLDKVPVLPYNILPIEHDIGDVPIGEWVSEQVIPSISVAATISPELRGDISSITGDKQLELLLFGGGRVLFGDTTDVEGKALAAATILSQVDQNSVLHIDVRAPLTPVLCRDPSCSYPST